MRAVTYVSNNKIEILDKPVPDIQADEVLIRVAGAGLCHSDLTIISMGDDNPLIGGTLGHEVGGYVERIGAKVSGWNLGDAAVVSLLLSCGQCRECVAGRDNLCEVIYPRKGFVPLAPGGGAPGGMADYIAVKSRHLDPIGDLNPILAAPLADAGLTPMHAINSVREFLTADATVVTIGLGGLGHMALQILTATTASRIIALDVDPQKLAFAELHGADLALPSDGNAAARILHETGGRGADVVLNFVGVQPTVDLSLAVIAPGGAIRFVGLGGGSFIYTAAVGTSLPWGVNIERSYGGTRSDMREVIALAQAGRISVDVTRFPLDKAVEAFDALHNGKIQGRAVLVP